MDLNQRLWDLWETPEADREAAIKVVSAIFSHILKDPNNAKFRDLNFSKIRRKFEKAKPAFYLLYSAGFSQNVDGSRLQFAVKNMKMLEAAQRGLQAKIANPEDPKLLPKSQKPKEPKSPQIKDKHFKSKYASSSVAKHEREDREKQQELERQSSSDNLTADKDVDMAGTGNDSKEEDANGDAAAGQDSPAKPEDTRTTEEIEKDNKDVTNALQGLDQDDMDLLEQIQGSKETTVSLSMAELAGKTKEEKIAIFKEKQKQFRKEKGVVARRAQIDRERTRRENVKMAQEAKEKRQDQQRAMVARKKARDKQEEKMRKQRIREKIRLEKERKAKLREIEAQKKEAAAKKAQQA